MSKKNPEVDAFISKAKRWHEELARLREIVLDFPLTEELKWGQPCYTLNGRNVVILGGFKDYCLFLFFKGALLKDAKKILVRPGKLRAGRQIRFTRIQDIIKLEPVLNAYIQEAIEVEKAGLKVALKKTSDVEVPDEFKDKLDENPALKAAFAALTPGRQRAYLYYFSGAKQSQTRESRVEKCAPRILKGKGLNE